MNLLERLASSSGRLLFNGDKTPYTTLSLKASRTAEFFQPGGRILLWSDRVDQIVSIIAAAWSRNADLYVAHRTTSPDEIEALISRFQVQWRVDDDHIRRTAFAPPQASHRSSSHILIMSSGTTRSPKIAQHTPENLFASHRMTESSARARWLLTYPPTSFAGLQVIFSAILGGADLVVASSRTIAAFAEAAQEHSVTHISGTPTFWRSFLLLTPSPSALKLRQITIGGEAVDQSTLDRLRAAFPTGRITHIYASTEAGVGFSVNDARAGFPAAWLETGVGDVRLRLRHNILEIRSPRMLKRYESGEALPVDSEGWLSTGDLMRREGDRVYFVGRADRRLNVGGFKVSPEEVEAVLMECDAVADVQVSGVPSPISGQVLAATVVPRPGLDSEAVRKQVQRLAYERVEPFKVPRIVRVVPSLEAAESGKKARR